MATSLPFFFSPILRDILISRGEFLIVIRQIRTEDVQKYFIRLLSLSSFILPYFSSTKAMRFRLLAISFLSYDYV